MAINKKFRVKHGLISPNAEITSIETDSITISGQSLDSIITSGGDTAYSNAVLFANTISATAYSNAISYADNEANTAYSNAISFASDIANTAYSNAISFASDIANTAYSNAVSYTDTAVANLIDTAPDALNTLNELSTALNDDPDFANTIVGQITIGYSNATSYADNEANTAYSNAISFASDIANTAYSNSVSYTDTQISAVYLNSIFYTDTETDTAFTNAVFYTDTQIAQLGLGDISTQNSDSIVITGGSIDGVSIGQTTANTGNFTTLAGSGDMNIDSGTFFVDVSTNRVGIGTTSPSSKLQIAGSITPTTNGNDDLGSSTLRWNTVYTSDLSLKNDHGDWTVVEGEDDLFLYNNKKGKVYKFALTEVDPDIAPPKRD